MKKFLLASLLLTLSYAGASAAVVPIQLEPLFGPAHTTLLTYYIEKNGTGPGNGNDTASQLYRLNTYFLGPDVVPTASLKPASQTNIWASGLSGWDYAVVHYGGGAPQEGDGGSIGAWFLNGADAFTFPTKAFSSIDFFRSRPLNMPNIPVPDGGTTAALLGLALTGLALARRTSRKS